VALAAQGRLDDAVEAFRGALRQRGNLLQARLNLALLLARLRKFQLALEAYRQALEVAPDSCTAWNGVGQVLVELRRHQDAKNAFARAVEADPDNAAAHYNLSFTLSNLGDFEGSLREVRRALELDPYYTAQQFVLAVELDAEDPALSVIADLAGEQTFQDAGEAFVFDERLLDGIFAELRPAAGGRPRADEDPFALARDCASKGLFERAVAEVARALQRGADRAEGAVLLGEVFLRRGLFGEALERFREARTADVAHRAARLGEVRALLGLARGAEARPLADALAADRPDDADAALLAAEARAAAGDPAAAVELLRRLETRLPARADVRKLTGDVALSVGDRELARAAYRAALELDPGFVEVWLAAGRLAEERGDADEAEAAYRAALDRLPSYAEAGHALAGLLAGRGRGREALDVLVLLLERDAYDLDALALLARVLLDLGRPADAHTAAARVLRFRPDHPGAHFYSGLALARERHYREAVQHWERCIALDPSGPYAAKARGHARTALDLVHIFAGEAA
jgi:tetratricopeptide (TPR) repeat protein